MLPVQVPIQGTSLKRRSEANPKPTLLGPAPDPRVIA